MNTKVNELPNSKESEMMVLGCMLTNANSLNIGADGLDSHDFYFTEHKIIFQILKSAYAKDCPADVHLVCEELKRIENLDAVGGAAYVVTLAQYAGTSAYPEQYIEVVKEQSIRRKLIQQGDELKKRALDPSAGVENILEVASKGLTSISLNLSGDDVASVGEVLSGEKSNVSSSSVIEKLEERYLYFKKEGESIITGVPTGFDEIDRKTTLLEDTNLIILAARPAMGKTALALNIAANTSLNEKKAVGIISLEMGRDQLTERLLSLNTGVPGEDLKRGTFSEAQLESLREEGEKLGKAPLFILDHNCQTISKVTSQARHLKEKHDIQLLVVDYLQLLGTTQRAESRQYEVAEISRKLKLLAMELQIPILCISQLSRRVEDRADKRPLLSDLRDSGQVEQDADVVIFLSSDEIITTPQTSLDKPRSTQPKTAMGLILRAIYILIVILVNFPLFLHCNRLAHRYG